MMSHTRIRKARQPIATLALLTAGLALVATPSPAHAAETGVSSAADLAAAFAAGEDIVLEADIAIGEGGPAIVVGDDSSVDLDLNGHHLEIHADYADVYGSQNAAAIEVPDGTQLTIDDSAGGGSIDARSLDGAAIGGSAVSSETAGDITINGGTIEATSANLGAGIGGASGREAASVTINGGTVIAESLFAGSGIGGGYFNHAGTAITINGGDVTARAAASGPYGAGGGAAIGGGRSGDSGAININGGTVDAKGIDGAGIGGGLDGGLDSLTIGSEAVVEVSSTNASAIGGADPGDGSTWENGGTLILPSDDHIEIRSADQAENKGLIQGDGELRGDGEIVNPGSIWHTVDVSVDVSVNDHVLDFDANEGDGAPTDLLRVYAPTLADAGLSVPDLEPTRTDHEFAGWFDNPETDGATGPLDENSNLANDPAEAGEPLEVTWYAGWIGDLAITTTDLHDGQVGEPYEVTITTTGGLGPFTWSIVDGSLPDGLSLEDDTGTIAGTPTDEGTHTITLRVGDSDGREAEVELPLAIEPAAEEPPEDPADDPPGDPADDPPNDPAEDPADDPAEDPSDHPVEDPPAKVPISDDRGPASPKPPRTSSASGPLPRTGTNSIPPVAVGLVAVTLGSAMVLARRRRGLHRSQEAAQNP